MLTALWVVLEMMASTSPHFMRNSMRSSGASTFTTTATPSGSLITGTVSPSLPGT